MHMEEVALQQWCDIQLNNMFFIGSTLTSLVLVSKVLTQLYARL